MWRVVGILLGILIGGYSLGVERFMVPGGTKTESGFDVVTETIRINVLETLMGALIGAFIGYLGILLLHYALTRCLGVLPSSVGKNLSKFFARSEVSYEPEQYNAKKNVLLFIIFIGLAVAMWLAAVFVAGRLIREPMPFLQIKTLLYFLALSSLVVSWVIVGRKISLKRSWRAKKDFVLLGPFNFMDVPFLNKRQLKVLWLGIVAICLLCVFPPWIGYESTIDDKGFGRGDFIGFHFLLQQEDLYHLIGEDPYVTAEISYTMLASFSLCVFVLCGVLMFIFRRRQKRINPPIRKR